MPNCGVLVRHRQKVIMLGKVRIKKEKCCRIVVTVFCLCFMSWASTLHAYPSMGEPQQKESKRLAKSMTAEGWKVLGEGKSVKEALDAHYKALEQGKDTLMPIEGHAKAKELNLAIRKSQNYAARQYASMLETKVEGANRLQISTSSSEGAPTETTFSSDFQSSTDQTIKSMKPTAIFYRTTSNGWVEVWAFYLVNTFM